MRFLRTVGKGIDHLVRILLVGFVSGMLASLLLQIAGRYVMNVPFPWLEELARYLMVWTGFLGSSLAIRRGAHLGFTILVDRLPGLPRVLVSTCVSTGILILLGYMIRYGWTLTAFVQNQASATLPITMFWVYLAIPVGATVMAIQMGLALIEEWWVFARPSDPKGGTAC
jgi:TRAP-type C4-dicarboxylate transport system permease small subunit